MYRSLESEAASKLTGSKRRPAAAGRTPERLQHLTPVFSMAALPIFTAVRNLLLSAPKTKADSSLVAAATSSEWQDGYTRAPVGVRGVRAR